MSALKLLPSRSSAAATASGQRPGGDDEAAQLRRSLDLVGRYTEIALDSSQSRVAAVLYAREINKFRTPEAAIAYYTDLLPKILDVEVRRAIRFELVELYLHSPTPDPEKALDQLRRILLPESDDQDPPAKHKAPAESDQ